MRHTNRQPDDPTATHFTNQSRDAPVCGGEGYSKHTTPCYIPRDHEHPGTAATLVRLHGGGWQGPLPARGDLTGRAKMWLSN